MHDVNKTAKSTTNVTANPGVVIQIILELGIGSLIGNTIVALVGSLLFVSSIANVKSPVDTTLMIRLTPTVFSGDCKTISRDFLLLSSRGRSTAAWKNNKKKYKFKNNFPNSN